MLQIVRDNFKALSERQTAEQIIELDLIRVPALDHDGPQITLEACFVMPVQHHLYNQFCTDLIS